MRYRSATNPTVLKAMQIGQAGVCRVTAELILRGHCPCTPSIDFGVDLMTVSGVRIQVKTSTLRVVTKLPAYKFQLYQSEKILHPDGRKGWKNFNRKWSAVCDFVILHGTTENRYWIVPATLMDGCASVYATGVNTPGRKDYTEEDALKMRADLHAGKSVEEVAALWGVGKGVIFRVRRGEKICPAAGRRASRAREIRKLENRWDLIDDFIRTVKQPETEVTEATPQNEKEHSKCQTE